MRALLNVTLVAACSWMCYADAEVFEAKWESLDKRPVPQWWRDAKFGIFVHWGPYAVPAYAPADSNDVDMCYAEWYQGRLLRGKEDFVAHHANLYGSAPYANFAASFRAENFNARDWADLFRKAGAKYAVLTSKHHDGYALWPSAVTPYYNSVSLGSGRDLAGEFTREMKAAGLKSGFYFSLLEYANPLYPKNFLGRKDASSLTMKEWARHVNIPQMKELVERYEADILWPDGEWDAPSEDQLSEEFLAWLYNESRMRDTIVVNDRWGKGARGHHGGHYTTEYAAETGDTAGISETHPWEECRGIGRSFGYNRYEGCEQYMSREKCVETLVSVVAAGGNLLLNVGPTADGRIPPVMQDRLLAIGRWLSVNGEAIYGTTKWPAAPKDAGKRIYFTMKRDAIYMIVFESNGESVRIPGFSGVVDVKMLGSNRKMDFEAVDGTVVVKLPRLALGENPCEFAPVFRIAQKR